MLVLECFQGAFAGGVRGSDELCHIGTGELTVVVEGILEDIDDGLLEGNDLGLQLVLGNCWDSLVICSPS